MDERQLNPSKNDSQRIYRAVQDICVCFDPDTIIDVLATHIATQVFVHIPENERPKTLRQIDHYIRQHVRDLKKAMPSFKPGETEVQIGDTIIEIKVVPD